MQPFGQQASPGNFLQQIRQFSADCAQVEEIVTELQKLLLQIKMSMPPDRVEATTQAMGQLLAAQSGLTGARMVLEMATMPQQQAGAGGGGVREDKTPEPTTFTALVEQAGKAKFGLPHAPRRYTCQDCGQEQKISTNHTDDVSDYCRGCSWKPSFGKTGHNIPALGGHTYRRFSYVGELKESADDIERTLGVGRYARPQTAADRKLIRDFLAPNTTATADAWARRPAGPVTTHARSPFQLSIQKTALGKKGGVHEALATTSHHMSGGGGTATQTLTIPEREYQIREFTDGPVTRYELSRIGNDLRAQVPIYVFHDQKTGAWKSTLFQEDDGGGDRHAELVKRWLFQGRPARITDAMEPVGGSPPAWPFMDNDGYERPGFHSTQRPVGIPDPGPGQGHYAESSFGALVDETKRFSKSEVVASLRQHAQDIRDGKIKTRSPNDEPHTIIGPDGKPHIPRGRVGAASRVRVKKGRV